MTSLHLTGDFNNFAFSPFIPTLGFTDKSLQLQAHDIAHLASQLNIYVVKH